MDGVEYTAECLVVLRRGIKGETGLRIVLDALFDIDIVYGYALRAATTAFRNGWFIDCPEKRRERLVAALGRMAAWIYRDRVVPISLASFLAVENARNGSGDSPQNVISFRKIARVEFGDYMDITSIHDLDERFAGPFRLAKGKNALENVQC